MGFVFFLIIFLFLCVELISVKFWGKVVMGGSCFVLFFVYILIIFLLFIGLLVVVFMCWVFWFVILFLFWFLFLFFLLYVLLCFSLFLFNWLDLIYILLWVNNVFFDFWWYCLNFLVDFFFGFWSGKVFVLLLRCNEVLFEMVFLCKMFGCKLVV